MINAIEFGLLSPTVIKKLAVTEITKAELYDNDGFPLEGGVMDPKLGVIDPGLRCRTCGQGVAACFGHFGYIELVRPVLHVLHIKLIHRILRMICRACSRAIAISPTAAVRKCPYCGEEQKPIRFERPYSLIEGERRLTPIEIRERFEKIPDGDLPALGLVGGRPEWLVLTLLPIPPVVTRPSITLETGERSEDDLTHKMVDIIRINHRLREDIEIGAPDFIIEDLWELLQYHVATFFDNELSGIPAARHRSGRPLKTLADRLRSKEGRFRQNLAGKRVNFSARTVISPDPCISINEVGVPLAVAKELTIPVTVQAGNIKQLRALITRTPAWPCANYIIRPDGKRKKITPENKEEIAKEIAPGYTVERQLQNGDIVLFNRQPSLHRMSIMAHRIRVTPWRTFTLNIAVVRPYNADFDGDEMNLHVLQTEEARAEAKLLMQVQKHIRSPRFGGPITGCEHDHVSGCYLLTRDETVVDRKTAYQLLSEIGLKPKLGKKKTFSGKEIFSALLPPDLNLKFRSKTGEHVIIKNGRLIKGIIDMKAIGHETGKLIDIIEKVHGADAVRAFIDRAALLGIKWLERSGFTIGLDDIELGKDAQEQVEAAISRAIREVENLIAAYKAGEIKILAGRSAAESLEDHILKALARCSEDTGMIIERLFPENPAVWMARSGARGSMVHIAQLAAAVGQARVLGERIHRGYTERTLAHFKANDLSAAARGFIARSFKSGLTPFEFFFDAVSSREGLMDKSLRTRHSGYLERRLMNALQDLKIEYDGTIRDSRKVIIQFVPGEDRIDPAKSDWGMLDVRSIVQSVVGVRT
jgi:DNA-directed RNA polymerase subunit A'